MRFNFVSTSFSISLYGTCVLFPLRFTADPFEWAFLALTPHYQRYSSTVNQSDCRLGVPSPRLCSTCQRLPLKSNRLSRVPALTHVVTRRGLRPRHVFPYSPFRTVLFRLQRNEAPGLRATRVISGLNPFTRITTDSLRPSGFTRFVASPRAEFCSELVVSLYSCWFLQLGQCRFSSAHSFSHLTFLIL